MLVAFSAFSYGACSEVLYVTPQVKQTCGVT